MIKNYIKIAWRNLKRNRANSLINTLGLSVGIASCLLIFLFVQDELGYDRYHENANRIYRVYGQYQVDDEYRNSLSTSNLLGPTLEKDIAGIEASMRLSKRWPEVLVEKGTNAFYEEKFFFADPSIFEIFSFQMVKGNPKTALDHPFSIVLTEEMARKYFGDTNPIGKTLVIQGLWGPDDYEVTGIMENTRHDSHFSINFLTSLETLRLKEPGSEDDFEHWFHVGSYTYVMLGQGIAPEDLTDDLKTLVARHQADRAETLSYRLQPITDIHLYSQFEREIEPNSDARYLYIFGCVAFLILIIAGINYTNLATAKSADRAMEVGIRKTLGVTRLQISFQFLIESLILCSFSIILALVLSDALLPLFNNLTDKELSIPYSSFYFIFSLILLTAGCSFATGIYPAFILSKFSPGKVLKGETRNKKKSLLRNGLIVFQFAVSVILIVSTLVIYNQLEYISNKKLGLNSEQVISVHANDGLQSKFPVFRDELLRHSSVKSVTFTGQSLPGTSVSAMCLYPKGTQPHNTNVLAIGPEFTETMEIPLIRGRDIDEFSISRESDFFPVLINETAMKEFGWEDDPIGKTFECFTPTPQVVGVVGDFHYESLKKEIFPVVLMPGFSIPRITLIRVQTNDIRTTLDRVVQAWNKVGPGTPLVYSFMNSDFDNLYKAEDRLASLFSYFTVLAIIIACLGLFGLAAYTAERRSKEIGIRKVLGATVSNIVGLLNKDFVKLVILGFLIAVPIAWYAMNRWLADFAYRVEIGAGIFLLAGGAAVLIALATVSWQSIRAALANPAESLRSE